MAKSFITGATLFFICGLVLFSGCAGNSEGPSGDVVSTPDSSFECQDTDGGKNYEKKGSVLDKYNKVNTDYCEERRLYEFYCMENGRVNIDIYRCPQNCSNGKCITTTTSTQIKTKKTTTTTVKITTTSAIKTTTTTISTKTVSLDSFWNDFCDSGKGLDECNQKKGRYIKEKGELVYIDEEDGDIYLLLKHCDDALHPQARVQLQENQESKSDDLENGDIVEYKAILDYCGNFGLFYKGIVANEGTILSVKTTTTTTTIPSIPTTIVSSSDSPSKVTETYFRELMNPWSTNHEKMYDLISEDSRPSDFYAWKDDLVIVKSALAQQGVYFHFDEVVNEEIKGNTATVSLRFQLSQYLTKIPATRTIELVKDGGEWKLAESYDYDTLM
ncbi:MAG: hypothetical protein U9M95_06755 [Candidatus Altiarchaeota archaeon]|nr:hypothetical protein [Candidatus Altiarchaeota archaeon]